MQNEKYRVEQKQRFRAMQKEKYRTEEKQKFSAMQKEKYLTKQRQKFRAMQKEKYRTEQTQKFRPRPVWIKKMKGTKRFPFLSSYPPLSSSTSFSLLSTLSSLLCSLFPSSSLLFSYALYSSTSFSS